MKKSKKPPKNIFRTHSFRKKISCINIIYMGSNGGWGATNESKSSINTESIIDDWKASQYFGL
jgi:hypothetical protein